MQKTGAEKENGDRGRKQEQRHKTTGQRQKQGQRKKQGLGQLTGIEKNIETVYRDRDK